MASESSSGGTNYVTPKEGLGTEAIPANFNSRLGNVEDLSQNILMLVVVSLVGIVLAVVIGIGTLVVDQLHFNDEVYRDKITHTNTKVTTDYVRVQPVIFPKVNPRKQ